MKDTPENWQKAVAIAWRIEEDLQHSDWEKLFDPTFAKYGLKTKYAAELKLAAPIPEPEPEMTVGAMWEDYLIWKSERVQPTTFQTKYLRTYLNLIKGLRWDAANQEFVDTGKGIYLLPLTQVSAEKLLTLKAGKEVISETLSALSEAFKRLQELKRTKLIDNPFSYSKGVSENTTDMYKSFVDTNGLEREWWDTEDGENDDEERDRRYFSKKDRDIIINAFYDHKNKAPRQLASLIEFRFLTGCRSGEAFALRWRDCFRGKDANNIVFSRSYDGQTKITKNTKKGEIRIFKMYPKLRELLLRIKPIDANPNDLVFTKLNGSPWDTNAVSELWLRSVVKSSQGVTYVYPGVVTQLAEDGLIDGYLPFYNCRHTFISLMAHAGTDLLLLATACGNSLEIIQRHYLGVDTEAEFPNL